MTNDDQTSLPTSARQNAAPPPQAKQSDDEIALRASSIASTRNALGKPGDPVQDWIEAEWQLDQSSSIHP